MTPSFMEVLSAVTIAIGLVCAVVAIKKGEMGTLLLSLLIMLIGLLGFLFGGVQ